MKLLVFGLSITSSWGNGHATVYRGLLKALHSAGVSATFVEKEVPWYASNRDLWQCDYSRLSLYRDRAELHEVLKAEIGKADVVLLGSYAPDGKAIADEIAQRRDVVRLFYDIDTPVTLGAFARSGAAEYLRSDQVPLFDAVLSFTGGPALAELTSRWGAQRAVALYCALDPATHYRIEPDDRFRCRLSYMGTYSPDRHSAWETLFLAPARCLPDSTFVLAGPQYPDGLLPPNVSHFTHLSPGEHPAFYSSSDVTLNITRGPMVAYGYSPSVRLFEAAGCATCVVSDRWEGLDDVFEVGSEVLVAESSSAMLHLLKGIGQVEAEEIGRRARARALRDHTYDVRARQLLELIKGL